MIEKQVYINFFLLNPHNFLKILLVLFLFCSYICFIRTKNKYFIYNKSILQSIKFIFQFLTDFLDFIDFLLLDFIDFPLLYFLPPDKVCVC